MMNTININTFLKMKKNTEKIVSLTVYDASFAKLLLQAGVELLLVGDSLGMVIQGYGSTLPVTVEDIIYHSRHVRRGAGEGAYIMADMPFMSYATPLAGLKNAARLLQEGGANIVKLEGGTEILHTIRLLAERGIPSCAHLGLMPQQVHKIGGYKVQGREQTQAEKMLQAAQMLVTAGADMLLLECVPSTLAEKITQTVAVPVIGIGAGPHCDGQVLVLYDLLGLNQGHKPKFYKNYMIAGRDIAAAIATFVQEVKTGAYPGPEHSYD